MINYSIASRTFSFIKQVGEKDKMQGYAENLIVFPQKGLINSKLQKHECKIYSIYHMTLKSH